MSINQSQLCDPPPRIDQSVPAPSLESPASDRRLWANTKRVQLWAAECGDHTDHHATCKKLPAGRFYCRMAKPSGHGDETRTCARKMR